MERSAGGRAACSEFGYAVVMWAKVPAAAAAAPASGRPAPYNAVGRSTRGEAAAPDVAFDLTLLLP